MKNFSYASYREFKCDQCGYAAAQRGNMAKHKMLVHKNTESGNVNSVPECNAPSSIVIGGFEMVFRT